MHFDRYVERGQDTDWVDIVIDGLLMIVSGGVKSEYEILVERRDGGTNRACAELRGNNANLRLVRVAEHRRFRVRHLRGDRVRTRFLEQR